MGAPKMGPPKYATRVKEFVKEVGSLVRVEGSKWLSELIAETFNVGMTSHLQNYNQVQINSENEASASDFGHNLEIFINPW